MRRAARWRPWQFSLRSLLLITALAGIAAGLVAWRARSVEAERRLAEKVNGLGGSVEFEAWGPAWLGRVGGGGTFFTEIVGVELPGHRLDDVLVDLGSAASLKKIVLTYEKPIKIHYRTERETVEKLEYYIDGWFLEQTAENAKRRRQIAEQLPGVEVQVKHVQQPIR